MSSPFRADLHCHSTASDGTDSPERLIDLALEAGLSGLSITDHDTLDAYGAALPYAQKKGFPLLTGIEFSASLGGESIHILGYGFPIEPGPIQDLCTRHKTRRRDRNLLMLKKLEALGISVTEEEVAAKGQGAIGRPHIALVLVDKGVVRDVKEAFRRYLGDHKKAYVPGERISVQETLDVIHSGGGKAVIAHPHLIEKRKIVRELLAMPFDGVEAYYARMSPEREKEWVTTAKERGWLATGGSDYHGEIRPGIPLGASWVGKETFDALYAPR